MIRPFQVRAARALLNWSAAELAGKAGLSLNSIQRAENAEGEIPLKADSLVLIINALRQHGVSFVKQGPSIGVVLNTEVVPD